MREVVHTWHGRSVEVGNVRRRHGNRGVLGGLGARLTVSSGLRRSRGVLDHQCRARARMAQAAKSGWQGASARGAIGRQGKGRPGTGAQNSIRHTVVRRGRVGTVQRLDEGARAWQGSWVRARGVHGRREREHASARR